MEKIKTLIDEKTAKDLYRPLFNLAIIAVAVAIAFIGFYVAFSIIINNWLDTLNLIALFFSVILIMGAIFVFLKVNQLVEKARSFSRVAIYDFLDEYIFFEIYREEEKVEEGKIFYKDAEGYNETKDTVFVVLANGSYLAIKKVDGLVSFLESKGLVKTKLMK